MGRLMGRLMGASQAVERAWDPHKPAFYFVPAAVVLRASVKHRVKQLPRMQELRDSHELVKLVVDLEDAFQG